MVSGLTLYSGFGLGTLLMPVFAIFFPVHVAVAATAVVHGANNIFKVLVVGRHADRELVLRFGIPAIVAAFDGFLFLAAGAASPIGAEQWPLIAAGTGAAFAGGIIGRRWLHKVTMNTVQMVAGVLLLGIAVCLMAGLV